MGNVVLSALVNHFDAFEVDGYADHPQGCAWIDGYQPDTPRRCRKQPGSA